MTETHEEPQAPDNGAGRLLAQLRTLHAISDRLNQLQDVAAIGGAITAELHEIIDYHSCRVYRLLPDGTTLFPVAFSGELTEYEGDVADDLVVQIGEGLTGHAAKTRETYYSPNALSDPFAEDIPGTDEIVESMLGVPFTYGDELVGVLVLSKLGEDQFDADDIRMMEVFAPHAAVAMINAELLQREREGTRGARALLALSKALTTVRGVDAVLNEAMGAIPTIMPCLGTLAYRRSNDGSFTLVGTGDLSAWGNATPPQEVSGPLASGLLGDLREPHVMTKDVVARIPREARALDVDHDVLLVPLLWGEADRAVIAIIAPTRDAVFSDEDIGLTHGIADITSLALGNAGAFEHLEASHTRLRELDEMKTMFLEAVSHDLRTPLATVLGIGLTFQEGTVVPGSADATDLLDRLVANARKLERLLADLLDLDRLMRGITTPNRRPMRLDILVRDVVEVADFLAGHPVELDLAPTEANVDAAKVERIIENLLANAVRHTASGTAIHVQVRPDGDGSLLVVEDEGGGVPLEARHTIFEPFRQGPEPNRSSPGVGIGLSLVARFAELHGGRAWVEDGANGGASFRVLLPNA